MGLMFPIYFISLILSAGLTLMSASQILDLSDLDCNCINPSQCCANLNKLVLPEIVFNGIILSAHLMTLNWIPLMSTVPMMAWIIYTYRTDSRGNLNIFDPQNITDDDILNRHVRRCLFKTLFHLVHFVGYMYMAILTLNVS